MSDFIQELLEEANHAATQANNRGDRLTARKLHETVGAASAQHARNLSELDTLRQKVKTLQETGGGNPMVALRAALRSAFAHLDEWEARQDQREAQVAREAEEAHR